MSRDFLSALWTPSTAYGEVRVIKNGRVFQSWFPLTTRTAYQDAADYAAQFDRQGYDAYIGVLRRQRQSGKAADVVDHAPVLWADIDPYKEGASLTDHSNALSQVLQFELPPSIIVDSGHGIHAYWLLRDAAQIGDAQLAMKGIAKAIGGDHTHDAARVLRLPGTVNHKRGENVPVRLLRLDSTRRYRFSDFAEYIDLGGGGGGTPARWRLTAAAGEYTRRTDLPPWLDELIRNGAPKGGRSEADFKVMCALLKHGWTPESIHTLFVQTPDGIGAKFSERGDRYFDRTMAAAEASL